MKGFSSLKKEICKVAEIIYAKGLLVVIDGNVSARTQDNCMLITPIIPYAIPSTEEVPRSISRLIEKLIELQHH